jgi:hypothetical protein
LLGATLLGGTTTVVRAGGGGGLLLTQPASNDPRMSIAEMYFIVVLLKPTGGPVATILNPPGQVPTWVFFACRDEPFTHATVAAVLHGK